MKKKTTYSIGLVILSLFILVVLLLLRTGNKVAALETELQKKSSEYARIASEKILYEQSCSIAKEKSAQLLLLHGQAERMRTELSLLRAQEGKAEGAR